MEHIDIIEVRASNYFAYKGSVKEITVEDLQNIIALLPELQPIPIETYRLSRLNFSLQRNGQVMQSEKLANKILFTFLQTKSNDLLLVINETIRLPHVKFIHQLQNIYYDLSGDVLKRPPIDESRYSK